MGEDTFLKPMGSSVPASDAGKSPENETAEKISQAILALKSIPSEEFQARYQSLAETGMPLKNELRRKEIADNIALALQHQNITKTKMSNREDIKNFEKGFIRQAGEQETISFPTFLSLAENWDNQDVSLMPSEELVKSFENKGYFFSHDLIDYIGALAEINQPETNTLLHKILSFIQSYLTTLQNDMEEHLDAKGDFIFFLDELERQTHKGKNYLIQKHFQDILETWKQATQDTEKEGAVSGIAGGTSDQTIFIYKRLQEGYENRMALGINEGYPATNPLIEIAPGFLALYGATGKIRKVFPKQKILHSLVERTQDLTSKNDPEDNFIYEELNEPLVFSDPRMRHPSNKIKKIEVFWDFQKHLRGQGRKFFFDFTKIKTDDLHPFIFQELIRSNQLYIQEESGEKNEAEPISNEEYFKKLFPVGNISPEQLYSYKYLTSLSIRKKIEDDFGLDIATLDFPYQRTFLNFLESRDIENVAFLKSFVKKFGARGMKCFLSLDQGGQEMGEKILTIGEKLPSESAGAIFARYAELADVAESVRKNLKDFFIGEHPLDDGVIDKIAEEMLLRGKDLLVSFADHLDKGDNLSHEQVLAELNEIKKSAEFFKSVLKSAAESGKPLDLEHIRGVDIPIVNPKSIIESDRTKMLAIIERNYAKKPVAKQIVLEGIRSGFSNPETRFYLLRQDGEVIGFDRFEESAKEIYFGSVNLASGYTKSAVGDAMLRKSLDQEARKGKPITAHADPTTSICSAYIEKYGFVVEKIELDYHGMPLFQISRIDQANSQYTFKNSDGHSALSEELETLNRGEISHIFELPLNVEGLDIERLATLQQKMESEGLVITRFFPDKKIKPTKLLAVLEKKIEPDQK